MSVRHYGGRSVGLLFLAQQEAFGLSPQPESFCRRALLIDRDRLQQRPLDHRLDERPSHGARAGPDVVHRVAQRANDDARHKS
jgi:hypothetical protein